MRPCSVENCPNEGKVFIIDPFGYYCLDHVKLCDRCKHYTINTKHVFGIPGIKNVCETCYREYACHKCAALFTPYNKKIQTDLIEGCEHCTEKCKECENVFYTQNLKYYKFKREGIDDSTTCCQNCFNNNFSKCDECQNIAPNENVYEIKVNRRPNKNICDTCYNDHWFECDWCNKQVDMQDNDDIITTATEEGGQHLCEKCSENAYKCEKCDLFVSNEEILTNDDGDLVVCNNCAQRYCTRCFDCSDLIEKSDAHHIMAADHELSLCDRCYEERGYYGIANNTEKETSEYAAKLDSFKFNPQNKNLNQLKKLAPISIKELKTKHPALFDSLKDFITFSKGKHITNELINNYEETLGNLEVPIAFTRWDSSLQRSVQRDDAQLVLQVLAPEGMIQYFRNNKLYDLFHKINETSKQSNHPSINDQLGWARLELNPDEKYILVDEIQCDHQNAVDRIFHEEYQGKKYSEYLRAKYELSEEEFFKLIAKFKKAISIFPEIITNAISEFAKAYDYKKIFWHTYESGKKLKNSGDAPKSLYTQVPKKHWFKPTEETPFGLKGEFLSREARKLILNRIVKKLGS